MFDADTAKQPTTEPENDGFWTREQAEAHMRGFLASLPPPPSFEELARAQGIRPIKSIDDLPKWPENDLDAWDGFDEFLEELRHGTGDLRQWARDAKPDDQ